MTYKQPSITRIVASHEPDYWRAQATGFRLIRLLEKHLTLAALCSRAIGVARTRDERDFFRVEYERLHQITGRIARQVTRTNGYTILRARADDSPAYRLVIQRQPVALAAASRASDTPQFLALEQFRAETDRLAKAEMRATAGATYELYARRFSADCARLIDDLDPQLRRYAFMIAVYHGYTEDEDELYPDFGPGYCSLTGIDEHYCHCGRHP
ncbi:MULTISPECIES: hypothetical protein [Sphingobium]|uniref:Uncharacterized protein n=1 Tax=Sphingobium indicum (strain DSM 16413 / CCM 7287 / MTCC 6362 / UT26 / NBRC 101211 / UT26S) TaxID=452662 RepID=D4Z208_SPHIU|nr:hypothetical protein [Sphingobium indicum]BAI96640.1 hypothetical protein SJA_C1-18060 [Sphingobium indicum UT26S]